MSSSKLRLIFGALSFVAAMIADAPSSSAATASVGLNSDLSGPFALQVTSWRDLPFRTVVRQQYDFSCGSAALATLLRYQYGRATDEQIIFKAMFAVGDQPKIRKVGFSMLDMKRYLGSIGMRAEGFKVTLDKIAAADLPVIVVQQLGPYKHFVVIKGVSADRVVVGDPAAGLRAYSRPAFAKTWNGVALVVFPNQKAAPGILFNRAQDWGALTGPAYRLVDERPQSISDLQLNLPTLFQVSAPTPAVPTGAP